MIVEDFISDLRSALDKIGVTYSGNACSEEWTPLVYLNIDDYYERSDEILRCVNKIAKDYGVDYDYGGGEFEFAFNNCKIPKFDIDKEPSFFGSFEGGMKSVSSIASKIQDVKPPKTSVSMTETSSVDSIIQCDSVSSDIISKIKNALPVAACAFAASSGIALYINAKKEGGINKKVVKKSTICGITCGAIAFIAKIGLSTVMNRREK